MKKIVRFLAMILVCYGCTNTLDNSPQENYESRKAQLKDSIRNYNELIKKIDLDRASILDEGEQGYLSQVKIALDAQYPENNVGQLTAVIEANLNSDQLSIPLRDRKTALLNSVNGSLATLYNGIGTANFRTLGEEELIAMDSVYAYFDDFKSAIKEDLKQEEADVDQDVTLTEDEKLALVTAYYTIEQSLDGLVDGLVDDMANDETLENGRVTGWFKKTIGWLKTAVNVVATVITKVIPAVLAGGLADLATGAPYALIGGAVLGLAYGITQGVRCYKSGDCPVCVFCESDPEKSCYYSTC